MPVLVIGQIAYSASGFGHVILATSPSGPSSVVMAGQGGESHSPSEKAPLPPSGLPLTSGLFSSLQGNLKGGTITAWPPQVSCGQLDGFLLPHHKKWALRNHVTKNQCNVYLK